MNQEGPPGGNEFDRSLFPDNAGCNILPSVSPALAEVELFDGEGRALHAEVPATAVISLGVHNLFHALPEDMRGVFKDQLGAGMVACRILERFENEALVRIELPSSSETNFLVPEKVIAKKR